MRLFVALDIPDAVRQAIAGYVDDLRRVAPNAKWVRAESYHVTLKFIGEWRRDVREMIEALQKREAVPITFSIRGNGFFPYYALAARLLDRHRRRLPLRSTRTHNRRGLLHARHRA